MDPSQTGTQGIAPMASNKSICQKTGKIRGRTRLQEKLSKSERSQVLTRFVLALSDQQLATGLAILTAGIANRCRISLYEFQVVTSLAWFSSTTHLATLYVLRHYLISHPALRHWRVFAILVSMILLCFAVITLNIAGLSSGPTQINFVTPLQCVFNGFSRGSAYETIVSSPPLLQLILRTKYKLTAQEAVEAVTEAATLNGPESRFIALGTFAGVRGSLGAISATRVSLYQLAFISNIPTIFFNLAYALTSTVSVRWITSPKLAEGARRMGFGQIVSLFLLLFPAMAAAEIYRETKAGFDGKPSKTQKDISVDITAQSATLRPSFEEKLDVPTMETDVVNPHPTRREAGDESPNASKTHVHSCEHEPGASDYQRQQRLKHAERLVEDYTEELHVELSAWYAGVGTIGLVVNLANQIFAGVCLNITNRILTIVIVSTGAGIFFFVLANQLFKAYQESDIIQKQFRERRGSNTQRRIQNITRSFAEPLALKKTGSPRILNIHRHYINDIRRVLFENETSPSETPSSTARNPENPTSDSSESIVGPRLPAQRLSTVSSSRPPSHPEFRMSSESRRSRTLPGGKENGSGAA
ncbi:hypothetical protein AJ79_06146 [Helicocarpus griseus UAMH5409]|uniref:Uncharacterized protein n=1 Tax=Helicocarpus griseus UAMH5409 TaxID=1447875 RepID=A0A2B7XH40_9EURO|nr:hypothetical protein AJ79_06146 [Helicocarpus griseus UAMH5409]